LTKKREKNRAGLTRWRVSWQRKIVTARKTLNEAVESLLRDHRLSLKEEIPAESAHAGRQSIRRGVAPGSFIDLLVKGTDRITGEGFPDLTIIEQAASPAPYLEESGSYASRYLNDPSLPPHTPLLKSIAIEAAPNLLPWQGCPTVALSGLMGADMQTPEPVLLELYQSLTTRNGFLGLR